MFTQFKNCNRTHLKRKKVISYFVGAFVLLVHVSGMIGVYTDYQSFFLRMTSLNLVFSFGLMVYYHEIKHRKFWLYTGVIVLLGFCIELIGVNTGYPFGVYRYGFPFGPQIMGTPPVIGLNWFVLTYGFAYLLRKLNIKTLLKAMIVGVAVTGMDVFIEPVAIDLDYWTWEKVQVPFQNYVTWFVCVAIFSWAIYKVEEKSGHWENRIVPWIIGAQVLYFFGIWLWI